MKLSHITTLAACVALLPSGLALELLDPLSLSYSFARGVARDIRSSLRNFPYNTSPHQQRRRHQLTRRDSSGSSPGKCQLRLADALHNSTSPSDGHHTTISSTLSSSASISTSSVGGGTTSSVHSSISTHSGSSTTLAPSSTSKLPTSTSTTSSAATSAYPSSIFTLKQYYNGSSFFDGWNFWNQADPTDGNVNYLASTDAWNEGLVSINSEGHALMKVDNTQVVSGNRNSVRISFANSFNGGLLTADIYHMPAVCGAWPAWWTDGPDWPTYGEIDIIEGVNLNIQNQVSLHSAAGCTISSSTGFSGTIVNGNDCGSTEESNTGCGILSSDTASYGTPFNNGGGGVYAMLWDTNGIRVWLFHRGSIPADLTRDAPLPETWGTPMAYVPAAGCNPYQYMQNHVAILDTTLCGTWAGGAGTWDASCAASTGYSTCAAYVQNEGADFNNAYWEIASVKLYQ